MDFSNLTELIGSGGEADVFRAGNYAVKLYKEHCPKTEAFYEAFIHTAIEESKLPIPKIHEIVKINNRWAIVMDMIEGITMKDVIFNDINNTNNYLCDMADLHIKLHTMDATGITKLKDKLSSRILFTNKLDEKQKKHLIESLNSFDDDNKLCHGDFHFLNLIKTNEDIIIIDWIDAACGNPEADLCRTYLLYKLYATEIADLYLDIYCERSSINKEKIIKWLPIIAAARLSDNKANEIEQLLDWVNIGTR